MRVRIKLYATLGKYLPDDAEKNEADLEIAEGSDVAGITARLGLPDEMCHLVLVNGAFVAPSERPTRQLEDGDHLAIWPPVAGG